MLKTNYGKFCRLHGRERTDEWGVLDRNGEVGHQVDFLLTISIFPSFLSCICSFFSLYPIDLSGSPLSVDASSSWNFRTRFQPYTLAWLSALPPSLPSCLAMAVLSTLSSPSSDAFDLEKAEEWHREHGSLSSLYQVSEHPSLRGEGTKA